MFSVGLFAGLCVCLVWRIEKLLATFQEIRCFLVDKAQALDACLHRLLIWQSEN